jgi:hypothetical protein
MADIILHRRSFDTGSVPTTHSLGIAQFAINVPDGKVFIHKSSSVSESIVSVVTTDSITTGSITLTATASAALFIGQFSGSFTGVDTTLISSGSASAAIKYDVSGSSSLQINTDTYISGALYVSLYSGSTAVTGTNIYGTASFADTASFTYTASFVTQSALAFQSAVDVKAAMNILKGQIVHIQGADGTNLLVTTASYVSDALSANTLGVATSNINNNSRGVVVTEGLLQGLNTAGFTAGDNLYLGVNGTFTATRPQAPLHSVRVGYVTKVSAGNGEIYVRLDNGYELGELHDVVDSTTTASFGDLLVKSGSVWINSKSLTGSYTLSGSINLHQSASVSGTNIFGTASNAVSASNSLTASYVQFQYNRELHVSVAGSDSTGDGTFLFPFRTIGKALDSASSAIQIVVHPGTYEESPTVSGSASNVTITTANSDLGSITEISGSLTVNSYTAATRVLGIAINNIIHTGSQNLYLQNVTVRSGVSKTGNGYLEATKIECQSPANFSVTAPGTVVIQNSLVDGLVVNDASAVVNLISNTAVTAPSCSLGILSIDGGVVYSQHVDSGSVFSGVGAVVSLANILCLTPTNTSASIKLNAFSGTSIKNVTYNKVDSTLGVSLSNKSHFQQIQADGFTGSFTGSVVGTITNADTASFANTGFTINSSSLFSLATTSSAIGVNSFTVATGSSRGSVLNYTVASASNARAGQVMTTWVGSNIAYSETQTTDIGSTAGVSFTSSLSGANVVYNFGTATAGWNIEFLVTHI